MTDRNRYLVRKSVQIAALAAAVVALILAFSPGAATRLGSVKEQGERRTMPDFELPDMNGASWRLSGNRGRVVLVNFWATWCPPCRVETPGLVNLHKKYASEGFSVVGISLDDDPAEVVPPFVKQYKMPYPVLTPTPDFDLAMQIESLPTTFLIDGRGRIARTYLGMVSEGALERDIEQVLAERSGAMERAD